MPSSLNQPAWAQRDTSQVVCLGISGASRCGKGTLADNLVKTFGEAMTVNVVNLDKYFFIDWIVVSRGDKTLFDRHG